MGQLTFGPFAFEPGTAMLTRDGKPVTLGGRGAAILGALLEANSGPVSKDVLFELAWPGTSVEESNLTVQIAALRKALGLRSDGSEWIVTVPRVGYRLIRSEGQRTNDHPASDHGRLPSLAVLPFVNLSAEAADEYFADGIVEDLTTALSRFGTFSVVSRSSAFTYKNRSVDTRQAAKELGVRYVLEGGVRRQDKRVRVTASLLDAETGSHEWADKFDGELTDIFDFQDRITETVVGFIEPQIRLAEIERARRRPPDSLDAYDLYLRALPYIYGMDSSGFAIAYDYLRQAISIDPRFAIAIAFAAWALEKRVSLKLPPLGPDDNAECIRLARAALAADGDEPLALAIAGFIFVTLANELDTGLALVRRARRLNPNSLVALNLCGAANMLAGDLDESLAAHLRAVQLSPNAPDSFWALSGVATVEFLKGNYEAAIDWNLRSLNTLNDWPFTYLTLVPAYAHLGRIAEARAALARLQQIMPHLISTSTIPRAPDRYPERWELVTTGFRIAGLPD